MWSAKFAIQACLLGGAAALHSQSRGGTAPRSDWRQGLSQSMAYDPLKKIWRPMKDNPGPKNCTKPEEGEKVIYMIVHGESEQTVDGELTLMGTAQAEDLKDTRALELALGDDPAYRAQAVIVPPLRRAMQTAVLAFNESLPNAAWDFNQDIKGPIANNTRRQAGMDTVKFYKPSLAPKLKAAYERLKAEENVDHFARFVSYLRSRKEKNMIVVATRHEAMLAGANIGEGEVQAFGLSPLSETAAAAGTALSSTSQTVATGGGGPLRLLSEPRLWRWCTALFDDTGLGYEDWYAAYLGGDPAKFREWNDFMEVAKTQKNDPRLQPGGMAK